MKLRLFTTQIALCVAGHVIGAMASAPHAAFVMTKTPQEEIFQKSMTPSCVSMNESPAEVSFSYDLNGRTDIYAPSVRAINKDGKIVGFASLDSSSTMSLPLGVYDFVYDFVGNSKEMLGAIVLQEDIEVSENLSLEVSLADAKNEVKVENCDRDGNLMLPPIYLEDGTQVTQGTISGARYDVFLSLIGDDPTCVFNKGYIYSNCMYSPTVRISDFSDKYAMTFDCFSVVNGEEEGLEQIYYFDKYPFPDGLYESAVLSNQNREYAHKSVKYEASKNAWLLCLDGSAMYSLNGEELFGVNSLRQNLSTDATVELYINAPESDIPGIVETSVFTGESEYYHVIDGVVYIYEKMNSPSLKQCANGNVESCDNAFPVNFVDDLLTIPACPYIFTGMEICKDWISVPMNLFSGRVGQNGFLDFKYSLLENGEVFAEGNGRGEMYSYFLYNMYPPFHSADYEFIINQNNDRGESIASLKFDLGKEDPTPPDFKMLQTLSNGIPKSKFSTDENIEIRLRAGDWSLSVDYSNYSTIMEYAGNPDIEVAYSLNREEEWEDVDVMNLEEYFSDSKGAVYSAVADALKEGKYDIKIVATDNAGNSNTQILYDAFEVSGTNSIKGIEEGKQFNVIDRSLFFDSSWSGMGTVSVVDMAGRIIWKQRINFDYTDNVLTLPEFPKGLYIVEVANCDTTKAVKHIACD